MESKKVLARMSGLQYVLWKKVYLNHCYNYYYTVKENALTYSPQQLTTVRIMLNETRNILKNEKITQLKIAVEAYSAYLRNSKIIKEDSIFEECQKQFQNQEFWRVISEQNRLKIFTQYVASLRAAPKTVTTEQLQAKIHQLEVEGESLRMQNKELRGHVCAMELKDKVQLRDLEEFCEQLLDKDRVIADIKTDRDLRIGELEKHIRYLQENSKFHSDFMEVDESEEDCIESFVVDFVDGEELVKDAKKMDETISNEEDVMSEIAKEMDESISSEDVMSKENIFQTRSGRVVKQKLFKDYIRLSSEEIQSKTTPFRNIGNKSVVPLAVHQALDCANSPVKRRGKSKKCEHCSESFSTTGNYSEHIITKHFIKICCPFAGCTFRHGLRRRLKQHFKIKHSKDRKDIAFLKAMEALKPDFTKLTYV